MTPAERDRALVDTLRAAVANREAAWCVHGWGAEYAKAHAEEDHAIRNLLAVLGARREMTAALRDSVALIAKGRRLEREGIAEWLRGEATLEDGKTARSEGAADAYERAAQHVHYRACGPYPRAVEEDSARRAR